MVVGTRAVAPMVGQATPTDSYVRLARMCRAAPIGRSRVQRTRGRAELRAFRGLCKDFSEANPGLLICAKVGRQRPSLTTRVLAQARDLQPLWAELSSTR